MNPFRSKNNGNGTAHEVARLQAFSVYDEKAQSYNLPFFYPQINLAVRALTDSLQNPDSIVARHPEDFTLYHIGTFNDLTGKMESFVEPRPVCRATEIINSMKITPKTEEIHNG